MRSAAGAPGARILGLGDHRPGRVMSNAEFAGLVDTSDAWIRERTGIVARRIAADDETVVDMAAAAGGKALAAAGVAGDEVDLVLVATCSHPDRLPSAAPQVAARLGVPAPGAHDLNAACAGFGYALAHAAAAVQAGWARHVLVVGAEKMSALIDWSDRTTSILFADGAGAAVVGPADTPGIGPVVWGSDGDRSSLITCSADDPYMRQNGQAVFRWATTQLAPVARAACERAGVAPDELDAVVLHQANKRIIDAIVRALGATTAAVAHDVVDAGNTSAASIPMALTRLVAEGGVRSGGTALLLGFGGGLTYAGQVVTVP